MAVYSTNIPLLSTPPVGTIMMYAGSTAPPGWLMCNGSVYYSKSAETGADTIYTALFNVIGTLYGTGDVANTFKVPDLRKTFIEGAVVGKTGFTTGSKLSAGVPDHNHTFTGTEVTTNSTGSHSHQSGVKRIWDSLDGPWGVAQERKSEGKHSLERYDAGTTYYDIDYTSSNGSHKHKITFTGSIDNASKHNSVYGNSSTVQPKSLCLNYIIRY